jgi:hypothetical protein
MAGFRWQVEFFDDRHIRYTRRTVFAAANAAAAGNMARIQMGTCARAEIRRMASAEPARILHARGALAKSASSAGGLFS